MVITKETYIPPDEELTVPEVELSTPTLRAASFHFGKYCEKKNNEYMLCRWEEQDPRKCLNEGKEVTSCTMEFFRMLKKNCMSEFNQYATCIDKSSNDFAFEPCRRTQAVYDQCVLEKLNLERPDYGYFTRVRIHDSDRPQPPPEKKAVYEDATQGLPEGTPRPPAKYGSRLYFLTE